MDLISPDWWQEHRPLCTGFVEGAPFCRVARRPEEAPTQIYGRFHVEEETHYAHRKAELGVPLSASRVPRIYVAMQPYYLLPSYSLLVAVTPGAILPGEPLGTVAGSSLDGMEETRIGNAQAWYYPTDRFIVLWECFPFAPPRLPRVQEDPLMADIWCAFEAYLRQRFPDAERFVSPGHDSLTTEDDYQAFLADRGYTPLTPSAWSKQLTA
jgi:hypothetical protein